MLRMRRVSTGDNCKAPCPLHSQVTASACQCHRHHHSFLTCYGPLVFVLHSQSAPDYTPAGLNHTTALQVTWRIAWHLRIILRRAYFRIHTEVFCCSLSTAPPSIWTGRVASSCAAARPLSALAAAHPPHRNGTYGSIPAMARIPVSFACSRLRPWRATVGRSLKPHETPPKLQCGGRRAASVSPFASRQQASQVQSVRFATASATSDQPEWRYFVGIDPDLNGAITCIRTASSAVQVVEGSKPPPLVSVPACVRPFSSTLSAARRSHLGSHALRCSSLTCVHSEAFQASTKLPCLGANLLTALQ
jgi:hypothetical protein